MKPNMTLGELFDALSCIGASECDVYFDRFGLSPTGFNSYRGYYGQLALGCGPTPMSVKRLLNLTGEAIGARFEGYKGGTYLMGRATLIWVANSSNANGTRLVGAEFHNPYLILRTAQEKWWRAE